ncbi:hypothetical protein HD554DRAFT_458929 [Boletus coccyginus]|nr:hypothetical protein HD554DRAFT_458929 [Boletus coccyginus]
MITEFKNEAATSASQPYMQAVAYYLQTRTVNCLRWCCVESYRADPFSCSGVPLSFTDTRTQLTLARHMTAFRKAVRMLKEHYEPLSLSFSKSSFSTTNA